MYNTNSKEDSPRNMINSFITSQFLISTVLNYTENYLLRNSNVSCYSLRERCYTLHQYL